MSTEQIAEGCIKNMTFLCRVGPILGIFVAFILLNLAAMLGLYLKHLFLMRMIRKDHEKKMAAAELAWRMRDSANERR
jgi:hypothetical protein